nr:hypothetical protein JVH1_6739 [Rhodococcus sp. JVH1]
MAAEIEPARPGTTQGFVNRTNHLEYARVVIARDGTDSYSYNRDVST